MAFILFLTKLKVMIDFTRGAAFGRSFNHYILPAGGAMSFVFTSVTGRVAGTGVNVGFGLSSDEPSYRFGIIF
jgi:hypothetical protein